MKGETKERKRKEDKALKTTRHYAQDERLRAIAQALSYSQEGLLSNLPIARVPSSFSESCACRVSKEESHPAALLGCGSAQCIPSLNALGADSRQNCASRTILCGGRSIIISLRRAKTRKGALKERSRKGKGRACDLVSGQNQVVLSLFDSSLVGTFLWRPISNPVAGVVQFFNLFRVHLCMQGYIFIAYVFRELSNHLFQERECVFCRKESGIYTRGKEEGKWWYPAESRLWLTTQLCQRANETHLKLCEES